MAAMVPLQNGLPVLPGKQYYRATSIGEGSFGNVMIVYDDDGIEYAAKRFEESEEGGDIDATTIREIGVLRLLSQYNHPNIIKMADVSESIEDGYKRLLMVMPKYEMGNLFDYIEGKCLTKSKDQLSLIHGILQAGRFLHEECGIMHRDIKSDNIMLEVVGEKQVLNPILIDFSLAKFFRDPVFSSKVEDGKKKRKTAKDKKKAKESKKEAKKNVDGQQMTTEIGTATYIAPEVATGQEYNEKADVWSLGVICTEILTKQVVQAEKDKEAFKAIHEMKSKLKQDSPMGKLLHGMLTVDIPTRFSCRQALDEIKILTDKSGLTSPRDVEGGSDLSTQTATGKTINVPSVTAPCHPETKRQLKDWAEIIEYGARSRDAAEYLCAYIECVQGDVDFFRKQGSLGKLSYEPLYALLLAGKVWELELHDPYELDDEWDPTLKRFDPERYIDKELEIAKLLDYQFYIRK